MFRDIKPPFGGFSKTTRAAVKQNNILSTRFFNGWLKPFRQVSLQDALRSGAAKMLALFLVLTITSNNIIFVKAPDLNNGSILFADTNEERQALEQRLKEVEDQIDGYEQGISDLQGQKKTLANEIKIMDSQMAKLNLQIKMIDLEIQRLGLRINALASRVQRRKSTKPRMF